MGSLRRVTYVDDFGRKRISLLPEGVPDSEAANGVPIGPPRLEELGLPLEIEVRLNNELFARGILEARDTRDRQAILSALQATLRVDVERIVGLYRGKDYSNGKLAHAEELSNSLVPDRGQSQSQQRAKVSSPRPRARP